MTDLDEIKTAYDARGFLSPLDVLDEKETLHHRQMLEDAEHKLGAMHYWTKVHLILKSPYELATHPKLLDIVARLIGPDILLHNATYIIKEANSRAHVSWHQDLTYWGFDRDDQVSAWLALSVADEKSGCMKMIPGSHRGGRREHDLSQQDRHNVLFQNQTVHNVDERDAVHCPLQPGQASLHHGWTLHSSAPNRSADRRIGLNIQYIAPHVRQTKLPGGKKFGAMLVRGEDRHNNYAPETPPTRDLDPAALARRKQQEELYMQIAARE